MSGRVVATLLICGMVIAGCAAPVSGTGIRQHPATITSAITSGSGDSAARPSSSTGPGGAGSTDSRTPVRPMPPAGSPSESTDTMPIGPATSTSAPARSSTTSAGNAAETSGPAGEFVGATAVDPARFPGLVTDVGFSSPSGNIACGFQEGAVTCQIQDFTFQPVPAGDCHGAGYWGNTVRLPTSGSAGFLCAGDVQGGGPTLGYGRQITVGALRCVSRESGVTCQSTASGNGFGLARAAYRAFGSDGGSGGAGVVPSSLVGTWAGHGRTLTITGEGAGTVVYRAYRFCEDDPTPPCDSMRGNEIQSGGLVRFTLTASAGPSSAAGRISSSTEPSNPRGSAVTVRASGYNVYVSFWPDVPFCAADTPEGAWNCGA